MASRAIVRRSIISDYVGVYARSAQSFQSIGNSAQSVDSHAYHTINRPPVESKNHVTAQRVSLPLGFRRLYSSPSDPPRIRNMEEFKVESDSFTLEDSPSASVQLVMGKTKVHCGLLRWGSVLTINYREKPGTTGKTQREQLCCRLIDRPIRPLLPEGFYAEITATVLASDGKQDPYILAANAASAVLTVSEIPWYGPIGVIRLGRIDGQIVVNPTMDKLSASDLNLVYACTRDKIMMIDVDAREISNKDLKAALKLAHTEAVKFLDPQIRLAAKVRRQKEEYKLSMLREDFLEKVTHFTAKPIAFVCADPEYRKLERKKALDVIRDVLHQRLIKQGDKYGLRNFRQAIDAVKKKVVRSRILEGFRVDGRHLDEVRPMLSKLHYPPRLHGSAFFDRGDTQHYLPRLHGSALFDRGDTQHYLPRLHGSALFDRGDTQVLCGVTLGAPGKAKSPEKRFRLRYSFPPFCVGRVKKLSGPDRREVGHGSLAEKALLAVLPPKEVYAGTIQIASLVLSSDGSTSMATVCGGSMALMDAGIPLLAHVAGVSVGLVTVDPSSGEFKDYRIVTDLLGLEDHLGDMDFKVAGTRKGMTAIQLDMKLRGIPLNILCEALESALVARLQILDHMERMIISPRMSNPL